MTFTELTSDHNLSIETSILVEESAVEVATISAENPEIIFHSEGLNPCIGLVIYGHAVWEYADNASVKEPFIAVTHAVNYLSLEPSEEQIAEYCDLIITDIFEKVDDELNANKIFVSACYMLRCQQATTDSKLEMFATGLKEILAKPQSIKNILDDQQILQNEVSFSENYTLSCHEEMEVLDLDESDVIHFFVNASVKTTPEIIYYKGFESLQQVLEQDKENADFDCTEDASFLTQPEVRISQNPYAFLSGMQHRQRIVPPELERILFPLPPLHPNTRNRLK